MKELKNYQRTAIDKLLTRTKNYFTEGGTETIIFQSPTGSGKTFMATYYINEVVKEIQKDICFLWVSIGKGELHKQSKNSVKKDIDPLVECSLLERDFFGSRKEINKNEIVFLNWEKIRSKDKKTGDWKNVAMKNKETINFIEVLNNTRASGRKIILIIDESHSSSKSDRALEIRDEIVKPDLTIEMSATPVLASKSNNFSRVTVEPSDVIEEGMIKKEVLINYGIDKIDNDELDSQKLIIEAAIEKREELVKLYKKANSRVNPLVLIQIPNSDIGEDKKNAIVSLLRNRGITEEDGRVAIWLNDEKINNSSETLVPLDSKVEYLIFKQAIDTGWDCPRAQILVRFREINSVIFEIQTVGRILRMPEAHHYNEEDLNKAYVYTNIKSIEVKKEIYNPNIIKTLYSRRKDIYKPLCLRSYYHKRIDFGDITAKFYQVFDNEFCKYFKIKKVDGKVNYEENKEKLKKKKLSLNFAKMDSIIKNGTIKADELDELKGEIKGDVFDVNYSANDLEARFESIIRNNLNGFAPRRSMPTVKQAIYFAFKKELDISFQKGGSIYIQNIVVKNEDVFGMILDTAVKDYKDIHKEEVRKKCSEKINDNWEVPPTRNYNPEVFIKYDIDLSLYDPLYIKVGDQGKANELEMQFLNFINYNRDKYEWVWQNGKEHMETNFGIKMDDGSTFQPGFIVKYKDGRLGIFDINNKKDKEEDNKLKAKALREYIDEENRNGKNLIGGLVIKEDNEFRVNLNKKYKEYKESSKDWDYFENI